MNLFARRSNNRFVPALIVLLALCGLLTACSDDGAGDELNGDNSGGVDAGFDGDDQNANGGGGTDPDAGEEDADRPPPNDGGQDWDWDDDFRIDSVIPARGPLSGGTQVHVHGADLSSGTELLFGDKPAEVTLSQGQLVAITPPAEAYGPVTVRAIAADGEISEIPNGFTYADPVQVDDVVPHILPTSGGVEITLSGKGFADPMGVSFSGTSARRIEVVNNKLVRVVVPKMPRGYADLRVTVPDDQVVLKDELYFFDPIEVDTIEAGIGDIAGGEVVTLRGSGFTSDTTVQFGGVDADVQAVDVGAQTITVLTPPAGNPGYVDVYLANSFDARRVHDGFYYDDGAQDLLVDVRPAAAPLSGGTQHIVSGRNLDAPSAELYLGGQLANIVDSGPDFARIQAPAATDAGLVDVVFYRGGEEVDRLVDAFEYVPELTLNEVTPDSGSADGGDTVDLFGAGLSQVDQVSFGGLAAGFQVIDDGHLEIITPLAEPGLVDVVVTAGGQQATLEDAYRFEGPVEVWSMRPSRGALAGNTHVTLQGRGFQGLIEVDVGGLDGDDIRRIDPYTVTFRTPRANSTGAQEVTLSAVGQQAQPPYPFIYFNPMSSFGGAWGPPVDGSINVTVLSMDGSPVADAFVTLSVEPDTNFRGYTNNAGQVTISGPGLIGPQTVTATAAEMSTVMVREINATNLTLLLNPIVPPEGDGGPFTPPPMAYVEGELTITGKGSDPEGGAEYNMSIVEVTRNALLGGQLSPGPDSVVAGEGFFEVRSRVGDVALVALCGYYDADTDKFTPKLMGVRRYLALADGQRQSADIECDIPLDESLAVRVVDPVYAPTGPTTNRIWPYLDFGYEGFYRMPEPVTDVGNLLVAERLPAAEGVLDDLTYAVVAGSYTGNGGIPYSQLTRTGMSNLDQLHSTAPLVAVPELVQPASGGTVGDALWLGTKGQNTPDMLYIILRNASGLPVWTFIAPGDEDYIPMPEFPAFSDLPLEARPDPYQPGSLYTVAYGIRIDGFNYDAFTFGSLSTASWSAFSVDTWTLRLVDGL